MPIEQNMMYEGFVRRVFKCGRLKDPLQLADTDVNNHAATGIGNLTNLRLGVAYTLGRLKVRLEMDWGEVKSDYYQMDEFIEEIMDSNISYDRIHEIIREAKDIPLQYDDVPAEE